MKNRIYKRLLSWLLLFCIMITNVPTVAFAVDEGTPPTQEGSSPPMVTPTPSPTPSPQPTPKPSSAPTPEDSSGTSQEQEKEPTDGETSPIPSQVSGQQEQEKEPEGEDPPAEPTEDPEQQELVGAIADVTEIVNITVRQYDVQGTNTAPALTLENFLFYAQTRTPIAFEGTINRFGSTIGEGYTDYTYIINGVPAQTGDIWLKTVDAGGFAFTAQGASPEGMLPLKPNTYGYYALADGSSITVSPVEIVPDSVAPTALIRIVWQDKDNAAGLRPEFKDIISVYISEDEILNEGELLDPSSLSIEKVANENGEDPGLATYKITGPVIEGMSEVPASYIKIIFLEDKMPAYTNILSKAEIDGRHSVILVDRENPTDGSKIAVNEKPVIIGLEQYEVAVKPEGLSEEALANFTITATRGEEEYTNFVKSPATEFGYDGFTKTDAKGEPAAYTISWPSEIDDYELVSAESSGIVDAENPALNASPKYAKKFENSGDDAKSSRNVIWFDTDASYNHSGQLSIEIPVTVGDKTITVAPVWDSEKGHYVHKWTAEDMNNLGINLDAEDMVYFLAEMDDLIISDKGDNNLNRTLKATTTKSITVPDGEGRKEGYIFQLGEIEVTGVSYSPESGSAVIQDYAIGTDPTNHDTLTLYPMTYVDFKFDVRAGDVTALEALNYLSSKNAIQLLLKDSIGAGWQKAPNAKGYFETYFGIDDIDWETVSIDGDHASYRILMPLYDVNKRQIAYAFDAVSGTRIDLTDDIWLKVEYDNTAVPGMGTLTDKTYEDGTMVFILTGVTDYTATKIWADDGSPDTVANRPKATYTLWRYSEKSGDYTTAAMQMIPQGSGFVEEAEISTTESHYQIVLPNTLKRFDSDGYPYVYFIRESLSGGTNYEKIYGVVGEGPNGEEQISDTLPYEGERKGSDRSIYDTGTITNRRSEPITAKVTKNWKAAYYQDSLDKLSVEMTLYAKHRYPQGENDEAFVVDTVTIGGFDEFNSSRTGEVEINRFDDHGHELVFWWEETAVIQDGQRIEVKATADNNNVKYTLPLNTETMDADSYSETSEEYFVANVQQSADGNATVTNSLEGDTEYWLLKEWRDMPAGNATFQLVKIDENGVMTEVDPGGEYIIYSTNPGYANPNEKGYYSSGWIKAYVDLEKYDENGNRYGYIAKEGGGNYHSLESYGHNVDSDPEKEANSLMVINSPVGLVRDIDLRKVWLDDTANTARDSVYFNVYTADGQIVYGTDGTGVGLLGSEPIEITATNEWTKPGVDATLWVVDGVLSTEIVVPSKVEEQGADAVIEYKRQHLYNGDFYVTEVRVGASNFVDNVNLTASGYPTVKSKGTDFVVIYNTDSTDHTKGTNLLDEEHFYTVTNLRVGVTDLTVTKKWYDDAEVNRGCYTAKLIVSCDEDQDRVVEIDGLGFAQVHEAVSPDGLQNITNSIGVNVSSEQIIDTDADESQISFYNLPLYDEQGRILHYSVEEDLQGADPEHEGRYEISSSTMSRDPVTGNNSQVIASQTFTNTFKNTTEVSFDLLWLDDYRVNNSQRPDMFLFLYRTKNTYDENGNITGTEIVRNDFVEYLWSGKNNEKKTEDWWRYTFSGLDEYDEYGNKIHYYATIQTHANCEILDYIAPQYAKGQSVNNYEAYLENAHSSVSKIDGKYVVNHTPVSDIIGNYPGTDTKTNDVLLHENTFVIQLKNDINVVGHKVWEKIPDGFPVKDLPLLSFKLYRNATAYETEQGISPSDANGFCTAAVVRYQSPSQEYNFELNWYGINEHDGSLVAADKVIYDVDGNKQDTALNIWVEMTGLDPALYGQPLPKYDDLGEMYKYSIIEIVADSKGSIDIAYEDLESAVNGYTIINTYNTTITNHRPVSISKNWLYNGKPIEEAAEGFEYMYPSAVNYKLYRFYKIDFASGYSAPELMGTITLTREEAEQGISKEFEKQLVYAPNGNKYIYYVSEDLIKGYNTNEDNSYPVMLISKEAELYTREANIDHWPAVIGGKDNSAWYSPAFVLDEKAESSNENEPGDVGVTNSYTGLPQTDYEGVKTWKDYSNQFATRPDSLTLTLYRNTNTIRSQKVATIILKNGQPSVVQLAENPNVTSEILENEITVNNVVNGDKWRFTIECLDGYAPTGEEWVYSVVETLPDHYKNSVDGNTITNNFYTSYTGTKRWVELNDDIAYPEVEVKLQVSTDGVNWNDAASEFGIKLGDYTYTATLKEANGWQTTFGNLPIGTGLGRYYKAYKYRLLETKIGGADVEYNGSDNTEAPYGVTVDGRYVVNVSETAIENGATRTKLSVTKVWADDSDNSYDTRYGENGKWSVSYHIKRDYVRDNVTITETVKVPDDSADYVLTITGTDEQESVTETVEDLPAYTPFGEKYTYYAVELDVDGKAEIEDHGRYNGAYETTYENSDSVNGDSTVATNRLILVELKVTKLWTGEGDKTVRPDDIELTFKQNGETIEYPGEIEWTKNADGEDVWFIVFTMLPKYDASGAEYEYTVSEVKQGGYRVPVIVDGVPQRDDENQAKVIDNIQTCFSIDKLDENGDPINDVTLVFVSNSKISNPALGGSHFYQLTWSRDIDGNTSYEIRYNSVNNSFPENQVWASKEGSVIYGLPEGTYTLSDETTIPDGYYASSLGGKFTLRTASIYKGVQRLEVTGDLIGAGEDNAEYPNRPKNMAFLQVPNKPTVLSILKKDKNTGGNIGNGWVFTVEPVAGSAFAAHESGEDVHSARQFTAGETWTGVLIVEDVYKLNEFAAPPGYKLNAEDVYFKLDKTNTVIICNEDGTAINSTDPAAGGENGVLTFKDEPFDFEIKKYTSTDNTLITAYNTTFRLYDITDGVAVKLGTGFDIVTSAGIRTVSSTATEPKLTVGHTYRLVEYVAPNGYIMPTAAPSIEFTFGDDGSIISDANIVGAVSRDGDTISFTDDPIKLVLTKKDSGDSIQPETILPNVSFTLYDTSYSPRRLVGTAMTNNQGEITFGGESMLLVIGGHSYELSETKPNGYTAVGAIYFSVTLDGKIVIDEEKNPLPKGVTYLDEKNLVAVNTRILGTLSIDKKDSFTGEALNNISFELYRVNDDGSWFDRIIAILTGNHYILEKSFSWSTASDGDLDVKYFGDGTIHVQNLDWGRYKLVETAAEGYILEDEKEYFFTVGANSTDNVIKLDEKGLIKDGVINNTPICVQVNKVAKGNKNVTLKGAKYELYYVIDKNGTQINRPIPNKDDKLANWEWNKDTGIGTASYLSPGTYKLVETELPPGYTKAEDISFTVDKYGIVMLNGKKVDAENSISIIYAEDTDFEISIEKLSDKGDKLEGAKFEIFDITDGRAVVLASGEEIRSLASGALVIGSTETDPALQVGHRYRVEETIAPNGYILPDVHPAVEFTITDDGTFSNVSTYGTADADNDGKAMSFTDKPISLKLVKYDNGDNVVEQHPFGGVEFTLYSINGTERTFIGKAKTTDDGEITFGAKGESMLPVIGGQEYVLVETPKDGYTPLGELRFKVTFDGKIEITKRITGYTLLEGMTELKAENERILGTLTLFKQDSVSTEALNKVKFELYRADELNDDGSIKSFLDRVIDMITGKTYSLEASFTWDGEGMNGIEVTTAADGTLIVENLDWGRYKLVETVSDGYILPEGIKERSYLFVIDENNSEAVLTLEADGETVLQGGLLLNTPNGLSVVKVDTEGNVLSGAIYELHYVSDVSDNETGRKIPNDVDVHATWVWNSASGTGEASRLTAGTYKLVEVMPPAGYTKADDIIFTINVHGEVFVDGKQIVGKDSLPLIEAVDTDFEISIEKLSDKGDKLEGAKFEIFDITDGRAVVLASGEEIRSLASGALVIGSTETDPALQVGHRYAIEETEAPAGYILPDVHPEIQFTISDKGLITDVSSTEDADNNGNTTVFTDEPISLTLVKYDGGDSVAEKDEFGGVEFTLYDVTADREVGKTVTKDESGLITFGAEGDLMVIGGHEYTLTETAMSGYETLGVLRFKVSFDGEIEIIERPEGYSLKSSTALEAVNERILGTLTLLKEDSVSTEALNNVKFELYRAKILDEDGEPLTWFERLISLITGNGYILTDEFSWTGSGSNGITDYIAEDGQIVVENLDWGEYKLVETVADGYILPDNAKLRTYSFVINEENTDAALTLGEKVLEKNTIFNQPNRVIVQKVDGEDNTIILPGAEYELYYVKDKAGNEIERQIPNDTDAIATWVWDSETGIGEATHLSPGTYKLVEIKSPYGYIIEEPIFFEIDASGVVTVDGEAVESIENTPVVKAADTKTRFSFTKLELYNEGCADGYSIDPTATRILDGVTFTAYEDKELTKEIMSAVSKDGVVEFIGLPLGINYIKETATVPGHVLDDTLYMVEITSEGDDKLLYADGGSEVDDNTVVNDVYRGSFSFTKVSELDNNTIIPGAVYGLYKTVKLDFGPVSIPHEVLVTEATADEFGYVEFTGLLMDVEYTIRELSVPAGCYVSANPIVFKLTWTESGVVTTIIDDGDGTMADDSNGYIWREPQTVIEFLKTDHKGVPLPGAVLQLRDKDGNTVMVPDFNGEIVESWVSTKTALVLTGILEAGETYWLYELDAPAGYGIAKPVKFTVPDESVAPDQAFVVTIIMKNYPYPVTGDESNLFGYMAAMGTSGLGLIFLAIFSRHRKRKSV